MISPPTGAVSAQVGACWLNSKQLVRDGFETAFQFQISEPSTAGADGLTFLILGSGSRGLSIGGVATRPVYLASL